MNLILAHGSSDDRHRRQVRGLALKVAERLAEPVEAGFLDGGSLPAGSTVLPLFLGEGRHVLNDAAQLARQSDCILLPSLACLADRLAMMAADQAEMTSSSCGPVLFAIYRLRGFERLVAGLYEQKGRFPLMAVASLHGLPDLPSILDPWQSGGVRDVTIQPAFLFQGHTMEQLRTGIREMAADIDCKIGPPLADHPEFPCLLAECFRGGKNHET